ncbi:MAG: carboxypeptidase M32 [Candidatus Thorarchaeota archaeon]
MSEAYDELVSKMKEFILLGNVMSIVNWDLETYMPPKGIMQRSEQRAQLGKMLHRMITDPKIGKLLEETEKKSNDLNEVQNRNVFIVRREYDKRTKIPEDLVAKIARQGAISLETWKKAKAANDWKMFKPELQKMVDLSRERAEIEAKVKGIPIVYDSMLDDFERGLTSEQVSKVFSELRNRLVPLAEKCADSSKDLDSSFLDRKVPVDIQRKIATDLSNLIAYDTITEQAGGRIDEVEHPFTTGYYDDVRITVKYHEDDVSSAIYAILHEGGHALYEQNLNQEWKYTPVGNSASYGIHESQSRFVENMIGRSPEFLKFYLPKLNDFTGGTFSDIDDSTFIKAMNIVEPSLIRIEADEVTYSLHIIIRFEIERDLFSGKITVSELPQLWNEKYKEYLGVDVPDDTNGVLQDTHWASGYYGYFPSYALGNIYDGMFLSKLNKDVPDWLNKVEKGDLLQSIDWMSKNVHGLSALYDPADLMEKVTGNRLTAKPFLDYLEKKYSAIFGF